MWRTISKSSCYLNDEEIRGNFSPPHPSSQYACCRVRRSVAFSREAVDELTKRCVAKPTNDAGNFLCVLGRAILRPRKSAYRIQNATVCTRVDIRSICTDADAKVKTPGRIGDGHTEMMWVPYSI